MSSALKSASAEPSLSKAMNTGHNAELMATQFDAMATQLTASSGAATVVPGSTNAAGELAAGLATVNGATPLRNITVLPKVEGSGVALQFKPRAEARYQRVKRLGAGAMGEVDLVQDNDIGRTVAVKQLVQSTQNPVGVARFIDEIRTIGQLEHPNIVPIHDVGVDQHGQIFFVMKYIDGETLESVIRKLQAGDPAYLARYTVDYRMEIFIGLLHALQCAHAKRVIHRDIKPANVMVGRFGEVVLMDWGLAKVMPSAPPPSESKEASEVSEFTGTPAYMSPEQAASRPSAIAPSTDIYSAIVLFHELLALRHYLADCSNVQQLLIAIAWERFPFQRLSTVHHPDHPAPPAELLHFLAKGLAKDPRDRYQSVDEMLDELQAMRDGRCRVKCPVTLAKRMTNEVGHALGRYPYLSISAFYGTLLLLAYCVCVTFYTLVIHKL